MFDDFWYMDVWMKWVSIEWTQCTRAVRRKLQIYLPEISGGVYVLDCQIVPVFWDGLTLSCVEFPQHWCSLASCMISRTSGSAPQNVGSHFRIRHVQYCPIVNIKLSAAITIVNHFSTFAWALENSENPLWHISVGCLWEMDTRTTFVELHTDSASCPKDILICWIWWFQMEWVSKTCVKWL